MALIEIDEADLQAHRGVVSAVNGILANPDARKLLLQARKIVDPRAVIPEIDATAPVNSAMDEIRRELAADRAERTREREERQQQDQLAAAQGTIDRQKSALLASGWTTDGLAKLEQFAQSKGVYDLEIAAAAYERLNPPAEPVSGGGYGAWGFFEGPEQSGDDQFVKAMLDSRGEDEGALNAEIRATLGGLRNSQAGGLRR